MEQLLSWIEIIEDSHQQAKVRHCLKDILVIVQIDTLVNSENYKFINTVLN